MEDIHRKIYGAERLFKINNEIIEWDLKLRNGMQKCSGHDRYGFIELNLYELENYKNVMKKDFSSNYVSNIDWKVKENLFPN